MVNLAAAIKSVAFSYDNYIEVNKINYLAAINLAEACYREVDGFKQFLNSGTSEEYGTTEPPKGKKLTEESVLRPNSPYAIAKVAAQLHLQYMHSAYNFPYTILRGYNTYGRKTNAHFFIERAIMQMLNDKEVKLGDPSVVRDWLFVDDHADGYIKALGNEKAIGETIQLATGKGYTTKQTAEKIAKLTSFSGKIVWNSGPKKMIDAKVRVGDNSKAKRLLDWKPKISLEEGLKKTIAYQRKTIR